MTQKELLYVEDIYNHENLVIKIIEDALKRLKDKTYDSVLTAHVKVHKSNLKKLEKLLSGEANG